MPISLQRKNKFCFFIPEEQNFYIVYNSINGLILRLSSSIVYKDCFDFGRLTDEQKCFLRDHNFIEAEGISVSSQSDENTLFIVIEIATSCNLKCSFCYQSHWRQRSGISSETIKDLVRVVSNTDLSYFSRIDINLIGGEPSLYEGKCRLIIDSFRILCQSKGIDLHIKLNTNGLLLSSSFIASLPNADIVWSIMAPTDYSQGLITKKDGSSIEFKDYLDAIRNLSDTINANPAINIIFRLNIHHGNTHSLREYLELLNSTPINRRSFQIARMENHPGNYHNELSEDEFQQWYIDKVIPVFAFEGLSLPIQPRRSTFKCKASTYGSFKLFADGRIGICNGYEYSEEYPLIHNVKELSDINNYLSSFKDVQAYSSLCSSCQYIYLCEGRVACKDYNCNYDHKKTEALILAIAHTRPHSSNE